VSIQKTDNILIICESPIKAKTISKILKRAGYSKATTIATIGHIVNLEDGGSTYNSGIYPEQNFKANICATKGKQKIIDEIAETAKTADNVIFMADGDRAGSWFCNNIVKFCEIPQEKCRRAIAFEITQKAIIQAIENPVPFDNGQAEADAELTRIMIDKLLGYALSDLAKKYIGAKSVGRCQSVGLKLVSDREKEILNFIPERYFNLYLSFAKNNTKYRATYAGYRAEKIDKFVKQVDVDATVSNCRGSTVFVESIKTVKHREFPEPPFCTATFLQEAAEKIELRVNDAMSYAQKLYESGKITYPKTDSTSLAQEFVQELEAFITNYYGIDKHTRPKSQNSLSHKRSEALRVTDLSITPEIFTASNSNSLLCKVYELIWQRTVASAMPGATITETVYTINSNSHKFELSTKNLLTAGYKELYKLNEDQKSISNLLLYEGEVLESAMLEIEPVWAAQPSRFTEASLVRELQRIGVGRPATLATIVETVLSPSRGYAKLEDGYIVPTDRGMQLADYCNRSFPTLINLSYTKELEERLDKIADGTINWLDYVEIFYNNLKDIMAKITETGIATEIPEKLCPSCGKVMVARRNRFGRLFYGCSGFKDGCRVCISID
jgi:DNA topoisomerase-1